MAVYKIEVLDFKRLKAARVVASTGTTLGISGRNCSGKSSFSDAIAAALGGKAAIPDIDQPIRRGAKRAAITIETEDWTAEQVFTEKSSTLKVVDKDGDPWTEPRTRFAKMLAPFSFDIGAFCRLKPKEMRDALLRACGLGEKLAEIEARRKELYDERRVANTTVSKMKASIELMPTVPPGTPDAELSLDDLTVEFEEEQTKARALEFATRDVTAKALALEASENHVQRLKAELAQARIDTVTAKGAHDRSVEALKSMPEPQIDAVREKMKSITEINAAIRDKQMQASARKVLAEHVEEAERLDAAVKARDEEKAALIAGVKLPIDGLEISDDDVLLDAIPLGQGSQSAKIKVGLAVSMASDPPIRIARITDASLLDQESVETVVAWAEESDYLVLMEFVANEPLGMEHELWIEDGEAVPASSVLHPDAHNYGADSK